MQDVAAIEYRELVDKIVDDIAASFPQYGSLSEMLEITDDAITGALASFENPAEFFVKFPSTIDFRIASTTMFEIQGPETIVEALRMLAADTLETSVEFHADELLWNSFPEGIYKGARGVLDVAIRIYNKGLAGSVTKEDIRDTRDLYVSDGVVGPEFWSILRMVMQVDTELLDRGNPAITGKIVQETVQYLGGENAVAASLCDARKLIHLISAQESRFKAQLKNAWAEFDGAAELTAVRASR